MSPRMSREVRKYLKARIASLEGERDESVRRFELKIQALRDLLADPVASQGDNGVPAPVTVRRSSGAPDGLRAVLTKVVVENPGIDRETGIRKVEEAGFMPTGKTPLRTLVISEFFRLWKNGTFLKDDNGRYTVAGGG